jgi:DNA-binding CsgD family transcriptional regulator
MAGSKNSNPPWVNIQSAPTYFAYKMASAIKLRNPQIQVLTASGRSAEELSDLAHQIYEAVPAPQNWPNVVRAIAESLDTKKGLLFTPYLRPQDGGFLFPWMIEESHLQLWGSKYIEHDIWAKTIAEKNLWQEGDVLTDEQIIPRDVFARSVFYREFLSTMDIGRVCTGLVLGGAPGLPTTSLSVFKAFDAPAFSSADIAWCQLLIPHLSRALGLLHRLDGLRVQNQSLLAAFDRLDYGACLLDAAGRVLHMNPSTAIVLKRGDGLLLDEQGCLLGLGDRKNSAARRERLKDWLANQVPAADLIPSSATHFSNAFIQTRSDPSKRYALQCALLPNSFEGLGHSTARLVVFITDPDAVQLPSHERLTALYGFTPSQARVAQALSGGSSHKEIASVMNVSSSTIASHVREVYAKVNVNRQADLMRHILALGKASV